MIKFFDKNVTANELAKWLVYDRGTGAEYWAEDAGIRHDLLTGKERSDINRLVEKYIGRSRDRFGIARIADKIWAD